LIREILLHPHPVLTQVAARPGPGEADAVVADLLDTMRSFGHCVGIAAPQIGALVRVAVVDCSAHPKAADANHGELVLVDPVIVATGGSESGREGCLSIPELTGNVRRATSVTVEADGLRVEAVGFEARVLQHEIDHLDGLLFLDRVESLETDVFRRRRAR
jgi:peptide deformylase